MTHISRKNIGALDYKQAQEQLIRLISKLETGGATHFINELFTEAERVMLIKRFAAIFMFQQDYSTYRVSQAIGISISTSQLLYKGYLEGNFDNLLACIPKNQKSEFLALVEDFMLSKISAKARSRLLKRVL
jgi:uncharacterized protein YerC